jgi:hypothetical protein
MHVYMMQQLAADHVAELRADAQGARHQRVLRAQRVSEARRVRNRRRWRVLVHSLLAR